MEKQHMVMELRVDLWEAFKLGSGFTLGAVFFPLPFLIEGVHSLVVGMVRVASFPFRRR